jgi:hypothetical protein
MTLALVVSDAACVVHQARKEKIFSKTVTVNNR